MSAERVQFRNLTMLLFAPSMLSLYAESAGTGRAVPHDAEAALRNSGGEAVLDGPMFEKANASAPYTQQPYGTVDYKHFDLRGVSFPSNYPTRGMTISVMPDGSTVAASGDTSAPGARVAVQLYPRLVVAGVPQTVADQSFDYLAALGIMRDGRLAFVVGRSLSLHDFAQQLADAGVNYAGYTDGGGSASLATLNGYVGSAEHRPVLTWLVARPSGVAVSGSTGLVIAAGLALLAGLSLWWRVKRDAEFIRPRHNPPTQIRLRESKGKKRHIAYVDDPDGEWELNVRDDGVAYLHRENTRTMQDEMYRFKIVNNRLEASSGVEIHGDMDSEVRHAPFHTHMLADEMFSALEGSK